MKLHTGSLGASVGIAAIATACGVAEPASDELIEQAIHTDPLTLEEMEEIVRQFGDVPLVANMVEDGKTPYLDAEALQQIGFKIAIFPVSALLCVTKRLQDLYGALLANDLLPENEPRVRFQEYNQIIGLPEMLAEAAALDQSTDK